jgi:ribonuclease D
VIVPQTVDEIDAWIRENAKPSGKKQYIGFDAEWRPAFRPGIYNKISLIQCATEESAILIQLRQFPTLPPSIIELLTSQNVIKVGVGICDDLVRLKTDHGVPVGAFFDIGLAAKRMHRIERSGLASLLTMYYG